MGLQAAGCVQQRCRSPFWHFGDPAILLMLEAPLALLSPWSGLVWDAQV